MLRRPFCGVAVSFLVGILIAAYQAAWCGRIVLCCGVGAVGYVWLHVRGKLKERQREAHLCAGRMVLFILCFVLGQSRYLGEQKFREAYLPRLENGMQASVQGKLDKKEFKNEQYIYECSDCLIGQFSSKGNEAPVRCNRILIYSDSDFASIGEILVIRGTITLWQQARNDGNFDARSYYQNRKIDFALTDITLLFTDGKPDRIREGLWQLRNQMKDVYQSVLKDAEAGVLCGMTIGDKSGLDAGIKQTYQSCGLSHVMAISGLHVAVVGMTWYRLLKKGGMGFLLSGICAGSLLVVYAMLVGMGTSVIRAVGMFMLLLLANVLGRGYDLPNALGVMAFCLLWQNPFLIWDAGFEFSFAAVLGIACVGKSICFPKGKRGTIIKKLFIGAAIQLTTLPLVAWHYYEVPLYATAINLLVLPVMGMVLTTGLIGGIAGVAASQLFGITAGYHFAAVLLFPAEKILHLVTAVCKYGSSLPGAVQIVGRPALWQMVVYYAGLAALSIFFARKKEAGRPTQFWAVAAGLLMLLFWRGNGGMELFVLDVGQGDASFFKTESGYTVFVDGGSTDVGKVGKYRILPFLKYHAVREVDYWMVSHTDADHISGLREILEEGYHIRHLVFAEEIVADETLDGLLTLAEKNGSKICYLKEGDILHLGGAQIEVLSPLSGRTYTDKNAASMVFYYEEGAFSGIFTGDIGSDGERALTGQGRLKPVLFYKAAHHGSNYSNSPEWLEQLSPELAVISCGEKNSYGHPGAQAVERMQAAGAQVYDTKDVGQIRIAYDRRGLFLTTYLSKY